jgi:hypothetical protein
MGEWADARMNLLYYTQKLCDFNINFLKISRRAAKNAKKNIALHFASFAALRGK